MVDMQELIIGGIILFITALALLIPFQELGEKTHFDDYDSGEVNSSIISFNSKLNNSYIESNQKLNETKKIKPLFTSITESFDRMGSMVQAGFDTITSTTTMLEGSTKSATDLANKSKIPAYFVLGLLAILGIIVMFQLIRYITGR